MILAISQHTIAKLHAAMRSAGSCKCPFAAAFPDPLDPGAQFVGPRYASLASGESEEACEAFMRGYDTGHFPLPAYPVPCEAMLQGRDFYDMYRRKNMMSANNERRP